MGHPLPGRRHLYLLGAAVLIGATSAGLIATAAGGTGPAGRSASAARVHGAAAAVLLDRRAERSVSVASKIVELSSGCKSASAEVENAVSPVDGDVYAEWMGCRASSGISLAVSTDRGRTYGPAILLPGSVGQHTFQSWDPAVTVSQDGTVYASFMVQVGRDSYPVVDVSRNGGHTWHISRLLPPNHGNWGDRDFIAAGSGGTVYVTWDFGPSAAKMRYVCAPNGSCSFTYGDLNIVLQKSTDYGRTWSKLVHVSPRYPAGGADAAPLVVEPNGDIDCVYQAMPTNPKTYKLSPGHMYFTRSIDGGAHFSPPVRLGPITRTESLQEWWIDGAIGVDDAGNIFATWDTQGSRQDIGWLDYSTDHGRSWSRTIRVTPDHDKAPHIVQVAGGTTGEAVVGWLSDHSSTGYALYLRPFSITRGWLSAAKTASGTIHGSPDVWPGDTFGISMLRQATASAGQRVVVDWGSTPTDHKAPDQVWGRLYGLAG